MDSAGADTIDSDGESSRLRGSIDMIDKQLIVLSKMEQFVLDTQRKYDRQNHELGIIKNLIKDGHLTFANKIDDHPVLLQMKRKIESYDEQIATGLLISVNEIGNHQGVNNFPKYSEY